jgi:hypothetical protein
VSAGRLFGSGFRDWVEKETAGRTRQNAKLLELVKWPHQRSRWTYSAPRVHVGPLDGAWPVLQEKLCRWNPGTSRYSWCG